MWLILVHHRPVKRDPSSNSMLPTPVASMNPFSRAVSSDQMAERR
jgi:hypothetical protein